MVYQSAANLGIEIDYGRAQPGDILQRFEEGKWTDYQPEGKPIKAPIDLEALEPRRYRLRPTSLAEPASERKGIG